MEKDLLETEQDNVGDGESIEVQISAEKDGKAVGDGHSEEENFVSSDKVNDEVVIDGGTIKDETVMGLMDQVKKVRMSHGAVTLRLNPRAHKVLPETDAELLAGLLRMVDINDDIMVALEWITFEGSGWEPIFQALGSNSRLRRWVFNLNQLSAEHSASLASNFAAAKHVYMLDVSGVMLTPSSLEAIALAAESRGRLERLILVAEHPVEASDACLEILARVQSKFPGLPPFGCPPHGAALNFLIAMKRIRNPEAEEVIKSLQKKLQGLAREHGAAGCEELMAQLIEVGKKAEKELLFVFPTIMAKYGALGGVLLMALMPATMDLYQDNLVQDFPSVFERAEEQVAWQLTEAVYQAKVLQDIINRILEDMAPLMALNTGTTYYLEALVTSFMTQHSMGELYVEVPQYTVLIPGAEQSGVYEYCVHTNDFPAFEKKEKTSQTNQDKWFMYKYDKHSPVSWAFSKEAGSNISWFRHFDKADLTPTTRRWFETLANCWREDVEVTASTSRRYLRDELLDFMIKKTHPETKRLLELGDRLVEVYVGPPKDLARALQKGPKWLLDLDRCTFQVDSFTIMVVIFQLFMKHMEAVGGRLTRFENLHMSQLPGACDFAVTGGILNQDLKKPPCLHCNFVVGPEDRPWTFEVMFILSDFAKLKQQQHKFYDISRAKSLAALLTPVFPPPKLQGTATSSKESKDAADSGLAVKMDLLLDSVRKAEEDTKAQLQAQQARLEEQLKESQEALKKLHGLLEAQSQKAEELTQSMKRMELQLGVRSSRSCCVC